MFLSQRVKFSYDILVETLQNNLPIYITKSTLQFKRLFQKCIIRYTIYSHNLSSLLNTLLSASKMH